MAFVNQFSFLLLAALLLLALFFYLRRREQADGSFMAVVALLIGLTFAYTFFRPVDIDKPTQDILEANSGSGQPVLLEFQSPYCIACMAVEPITKQVESEFAGELDVIRINVLESDAEPLLKRFNFRYTPTFIMLDPLGDELWRTVGVLDPEAVRISIEALP